MTPKSQAKKNNICIIPIFSHFSTLKKYHANNYITISLFIHFKHTVKYIITH